MYVYMILRLGIPFVQIQMPIEIQFLIEGSVEVYLPTIWTFEKQSGEVKSDETNDRCARMTRKKIQSRDNVRKIPNKMFNDLWVGKDRQVGSLKQRVQSHVVRGRMKKCMPLRRDPHFEL